LDIDLQEIFRVLNEIMPYIAQQKMREDFERNKMQMQMQKEMEIMGRRAGYEEEKQARTSENAIKLELVKTGKIGVADLDRPLDELLYRLGQAGVTHPALPTISPEIIEQRRRPYTEMMAGQAEALGLPESIIEKTGVATQLKGSPFAMDLLEQQRKTRAGREQREISRGKTKLGWAELAAKKKGEIPNKELKKKQNELIKRRDKARASWDEEGEQKLTKQINALYEKFGEKSEKDYESLAESLKAKGYTIEKIRKTPGMVEDLKKQGFEIWILAGYL